VAYYCLLKLHKFPHELFSLEENELAFVFAAVSLKIKADREAGEKVKHKARRRR
jgi:hypothetical protein